MPAEYQTLAIIAGFTSIYRLFSSRPEGGWISGAMTWPVVLGSLLSLTIVRMIPVMIALFGRELRIEARLVVGWMGPRGLASIVFQVTVIGAGLPGNDTHVATVARTILPGVLQHGISAPGLFR